jgi:hypothetical protein
VKRGQAGASQSQRPEWTSQDHLLSAEPTNFQMLHQSSHHLLSTCPESPMSISPTQTHSVLPIHTYSHINHTNCTQITRHTLRICITHTTHTMEAPHHTDTLHKSHAYKQYCSHSHKHSCKCTHCELKCLPASAALGLPPVHKADGSTDVTSVQVLEASWMGGGGGAGV